MKKLLLGSSILVLGISLGYTSHAGTCSGTQTRTVECLDHEGNAVNETFCMDPRVSAKPNASKNCSYSCGGSSGGDGGHRGGGYVDTDGDGRGDTPADEAPPGDYDSSDTMGGFASGSTSISDHGWISGTHEDGDTGRSDHDDVEDGGGLCCGSDSFLGGLFGGGSRSSGGGSSSGSSGGSGSSGSSGGYSCMVVTHFYRREMFTRKEWLMNKKDALSGRLSKNTIDGYHVWAPYAVRAMRRSQLLENILYALFQARTRVIEFEQGYTSSLSFLDRLARSFLELPSIVIGHLGFKPNHNYNYDNIYGTYEDIKLKFNGYYTKEPSAMIGW